MANRVPKLRLHKPTGQAVVTLKIGGKYRDYYLGMHGTDAAEQAYSELLDNYRRGNVPRQSANASSVPVLTVAQLLAKYLGHATGYYRGPGGRPTSELANVKSALKAVRLCEGGRYLHLPVARFGPVALQTVRDYMVSLGWARTVVNARVARVRAAFEWGVAQEIVPAECLVALHAVAGLAAGRTTARETEPIRPADPEDVEKVLPHLPPVLAALARVQVLSGARGGELLTMKANDIDRSGPVWTYALPRHKSSWRGKARVLHFGPEAQRILSPLIIRAGDAHLFSAALSEADRRRDVSDARATPLYPSHARRNAAKRKTNPKWKPGDHYRSDSYRKALERASAAAGLAAPIRPHMLRHTAATIMRERLGMEAARATLGHTSSAMTETYSRALDAKLAREAAAAVG
jgi:integrase